MNRQHELDGDAVDAAVAALKAALEAAAGHAIGSPLEGQIGHLQEARLIISGAGPHIRISLYAPTPGGETARLFMLEGEQEVMQ